MLFLYNNIAVIHVFAVLALFAWLFGGSRAEYILPVMPWATAFLLEAMICFPQHHSGETTYEARERVWHDMRKDPLVWVSLVFVLIMAIPFINVGLCPICDYPAIAAGADPNPIIPFIPFCVNRLEHLNVFLWFVPTLVAVVAAKHALLKRGKRMLISMVVWNGFALAIVGALQQITHAEAPLWVDACKQSAYFFSTFGYPNMAGDYFTTLFGLAIGLWRWKLDEVDMESQSVRSHSVKESGGETSSKHHHHSGSNVKRDRKFLKKHYYLIPAAVFFFCALNTLSRASIMLVSGLATLFFLHTCFGFFAKMSKAQRVKSGIISIVVITFVAVCSAMFMPKDVQREVDTLDTIKVLDRMTGKGQYHVRVATEIWKDHCLFGVGGWGYRHFGPQYMTDRELRSIQTVGGANVHNDHLQFLVEHGAVGVALLLAVIVLLLWPMGKVWKALVESVRFIPVKKQPPPPVHLFVIPAPVFCIIATAVATVIHAFGDCPMRSPAVLSLFFVSIACIDGFLPRVREEHHHHHH